MSARDDVEPAHLARAVLDDPVVGQVLAACGTTAAAVRLTLDRRWLDALGGLDGPDDEVLHARGVDIAEVLAELGPGRPVGERWAGRRITPAAREILVGALREAATQGADRVASWHLLVGLAASRDPLVASTLAERGVRRRDVRRLTRRFGRRA